MINWGIISTGNIAHSFATDFKYVKNGNLVAVASRSVDTARVFAEKYQIPKSYGRYDQLYQDDEIDAVYIATPHNFHLQNTKDALHAGKAVLCEKPLTVNPQECVEVIETAHTTGHYMMEAMWTYFLPAIQKALEWTSEGRIGDITQIKADFGYPVPFDPNGRMYNPDLAGGSLLDMGIYPVAMAWLFMKTMPGDIHVLFRKASTGVDNDVSMLFKYDHAVANLTCSFSSKLFNHLFIIGTEGYIQVPDFWRARACYLYRLEELKDTFRDTRPGLGFSFEVDAVNMDLMNGVMESKVMPHLYSLRFQEMMQLVRDKFC